MRKISNYICNHTKQILLVTVVFAFLSIIGMLKTNVNYDILLYLPKDNKTVQGQNLLTDEYGIGAYSVAVVENLDGKSILKLEDTIKKVDGVGSVVSLYDVIGTSIPISALPSEIADKIHKDNTDLLLITFNASTSSEETINAVKEIRSVVDKQIKMNGMSSMVLDTMNISDQEMIIYLIVAVLLCILVLELSLDSYIVPILLLLNIGCAILFNLGTNIFLGSISYITKALVAVLQLGVTTDFSIFLYHSYEREKDKTKSCKEAMSKAIVSTFKSITGSSLTTILGFLALCFMQLTLGLDLGIVMAKGVIFGLFSVLTIFPSLLLIFDDKITKYKHKKINLNFKKLNNFIVKKHVLIFIIFIIVLVPSYLAYKKVEVYYKIDTSLPKTLESVKANKVLNEKFDIVSPEIIILNKSINTNSVNELIFELKSIPGVSFVLSESQLKSMGITDEMLEGTFLDNDKYQLILLNSTYDIATDELNDQIDTVDKIISKYDKSAIVAGEGPLMKDLIETSDIDFNNVNIISIVCVFVVLVLVLKSIVIPILLIITIESAIFINMSFSYYMGSVLPFVAPIVLGTIQLGATIDYAILLTTTYIDKRKTSADKNECMKDTLNECNSSILVSGMCFAAATLGCSLISKLNMVSTICSLICRGAIISMLVVIFILPAILLIFDKLLIRGDKMKKVFNLLIVSLMLVPFNVLGLTKEETIYTNLESDGKIKNTIVTEKLINDEKLDTISDYTKLNNIVNINGEEKYKLKNNNLIWEAKKNDIFYKGEFDAELPIKLDIVYSLNGKKMDVSDMIGKSGSVKISINYINKDAHIVRVNGKSETLYTPFVVLFGTTLDNKNNTNINISNGKVSNNGNKSLITALATPGLYESLSLKELKGMDNIIISYDTECFELPVMYSVATPKLIEKDDLKVFNKLDSIYSMSSELQKNMNLINDGSKKLKDGSYELKSALKSSIDSLNNIEKDALTKEQVESIKTNTVNSVKATLTDKYKKSVSNEAWNEVSKMLDSSNPALQQLMSTSVNDAVSEFVKDNKEIYSKCESGTLESTSMECESLYNQINLIKKYSLVSASSSAKNTAYIVSSELSSKLLEKIAINTVENVAPSLAITVANTVRDESINAIVTSLNKLYNGIDELDNGIVSLNDGITTFNNEGINTLTNFVNNDIKTTSERVKALVNLSDSYNTFDEVNSSSSFSTKLIYVVDSKKVTKKVNVKKEVKKEETFIDRVKNLFK